MKDKTYKVYDSTADKNYYWISTLCKNCFNSTQIAIKKGIKVNASRLKLLNCPKCEVRGLLVRAKWNGKAYEVLK
jgi:hypothetical protein